jgi:uncharacterized protein YeaO (DUF488 family)
MTVKTKRVYEAPAAADGARVLVDRLWPRGLTKEAAALDAWLKDVAPSDELRKWYHAYLEQWGEFRKRYLQELDSESADEGLRHLHELAEKKRGVTLLYASKDIEQNHALVLKQLIEGARKPPTGTGPARVAGSIRRAAARRK